MFYNGLGTNMGNIFLTSDAKSRQISPENMTGEKGKGGMCALENGAAKEAARELGVGWRVNPFIVMGPGETFEIANIEGPGCIDHIWFTPTGKWRNTIIRMYWDGQIIPSVECPVGDFFASSWNSFAQLTSLAVCVNPGSAFNCYWPMPFKKHCRITLENRGNSAETMFYEIDYTLADVPDNSAYFHAQFRRDNPLPYKQKHTIVDGIKGKGQYVGTFIAIQTNNCGWWGEGAVEFYIDGDTDFPTIYGTGTEDYVGGSYSFIDESTQQYQQYTTPYCGFHQVVRPDGLYKSQQRFSMYRWHIADPVRFGSDLKVTIQSLGWREDGRYLPLQDDISTVAYWYQTLPTAGFPALREKDYLDII